MLEPVATLYLLSQSHVYYVMIPKEYPQNLHTPKIILFFFLKTPKNIEIQNVEPTRNDTSLRIYENIRAPHYHPLDIYHDSIYLMYTTYIYVVCFFAESILKYGRTSKRRPTCLQASLCIVLWLKHTVKILIS